MDLTFADNNVYLGVRGGALFGSSNKKAVEIGGGADAKVNQGAVYTLDVIPGLMVNDQKGMIYAQGGARSTFNLNTPAKNYKTNALGWRAGLGYAFAIGIMSV